MTPHKLTPSTQRQSSNVCAMSGLKVDTPALLQRTSTPPKRANASSARCSTAAASLTSVTTASTSASMPPATAASASASTSASTTAQPAAAKDCPSAAPMPLAAPVTTATDPPVSSIPLLLGRRRLEITL